MQIYLQNEIQFDEQMEVIEQVFPLEVVEKQGNLYLLFKNEEGEKVVLKCEEEEMTMTRFSNPKSSMRFVANNEAIVTIPTPMGIQHFVTLTHSYQLDKTKQKLRLVYDLKALESDKLFASYQMTIEWK